MRQTKVTDTNRSDFFKAVYPHQTKTKDQLIQLDKLNSNTVIVIDSCGWYYKELWSDLNVVSIETRHSIDQYHLTSVDGVIEEDPYSDFVWPNIIHSNTAIVLDYAPITKYRTFQELTKLLADAAKCYNASTVTFRQYVCFVDVPKLGCIFEELSLLRIPGYIITEFLYDGIELLIRFRQKITNASA